LPASARSVRANPACRPGWWRGCSSVHPEAHAQSVGRDAVCALARWLENPYYQFFCGELSFCHRLPFDRSSLTH
jgi:hypothetical protein